MTQIFFGTVKDVSYELDDLEIPSLVFVFGWWKLHLYFSFLHPTVRYKFSHIAWFKQNVLVLQRKRVTSSRLHVRNWQSP